MWTPGFWPEIWPINFWPGYSGLPPVTPVDLTQGLIFNLEFPDSMEFNIEFVNEE
jgi:hypothetical protein